MRKCCRLFIYLWVLQIIPRSYYFNRRHLNFHQNYFFKLFWWAEQKWPQSLLTILRLPPGLLAVRFEGSDDVLYPVIDGVVHRVIWPSGVAVETLLFILQQDKKRLQSEVNDFRVNETPRTKYRMESTKFELYFLLQMWSSTITHTHTHTHTRTHTHWPADDWQCSRALFSSFHMWMRPSGSSLVQSANPLLLGNSCHGRSRGCGQAPGQRRQPGLGGGKQEMNYNEQETAVKCGIIL